MTRRGKLLENLGRLTDDLGQAEEAYRCRTHDEAEMDAQDRKDALNAIGGAILRFILDEAKT